MNRAGPCSAGLLLAAAVLLGLVGCASPVKPPADIDRAAVYSRAEQSFASAVLWKPLETGATTNLAEQLAPLLLREIVNPEHPPSAPPKVFFEPGEITLHGKVHPQMTYVWFPPDADKSQSRTLQGVRLTLNARGEPVIWEVLHDTSGMRLLFVAQSLEAAAQKAYGPPLPGRRFAVELPLSTAPHVVVARVIDDGPVPMGPIVHLTEGTGDVATLICRCMTVQTRQVLTNELYELRPFSAWRGKTKVEQLPWLTTPLVQHLRLPPEY